MSPPDAERPALGGPAGSKTFTYDDEQGDDTTTPRRSAVS